MNNLFNNISWGTFFIVISLASVIYYAYIAWLFYRGEFHTLFKRLSGKDSGKAEFPESLQYQGETDEPNHPAESMRGSTE